LSFLILRSVKLRLSGQMPVSMSPMITSSPAPPRRSAPPSHRQRPRSTPRKRGVNDVSFSTRLSSVTASTPSWAFSAAAWSFVSFAAKPLYA
jgi:hypothetical protein